ncbi:hypothetical protein [Micromonospora musae]|uniref:hypothetical protein n=1 Tax=Micromonospora musae TaxID=1894970 RepID=UPI003427F50D
MPDVIDRDDERPLEPGEIITVAPALAGEMGSHLYVVIDGFNDPRYTIARLGGDGYQVPNVERQYLTPVAPGQVVRVTDGALTAYVAG